MTRRGTFRSVDELERAIYKWLASWNDTPKAFVWKATADIILDKVRRCKEAIVKTEFDYRIERAVNIGL